MAAKYRIDLTRIPLDRQGYTRGGRYYGTGAPVFIFEVIDANMNVMGEGEMRAADRASALAKLRAQYKLEAPKKRTGVRKPPAVSKYEKSRRATMTLRPQVKAEFLPLFDHIINLATSSHSHGYPKRAGRELLQARKLAKR